ncbi:hypothetical protein G6661_01790 [Polynucleobacter paneuropaeus]|nr:hypothetical protein G6661_01790 [Polynucleobacter paneuropaeus]
MQIFQPSPSSPDDYFVATYFIKTNLAKGDLKKAAWELAIGQSVGNPNVRNQWETEELFVKHSCIVMHDIAELEGKESGVVKIGFPVINTNWHDEAISHMLCQVMGGQVDIETFSSCRLIDLSIPKHILDKFFFKPKYGVSGFRKIRNVKDKPFLGAIVKPKTGVSPQVMLEMVKELVDGGVDFIKEDEILSSPSFCSLEERVPLISNYLNKINSKVIYSYAINADHSKILNRAKFIAQNGGNSVHANVWCGLGIYKEIRALDLPLFIHFQKSGDRAFTDKDANFGIDWTVICYLAGISGVDSIHAGMWGGYKSDTVEELKKIIGLLNEMNVVPALSCGMHPGIVEAINKRFGIDYMANVGGAIHGHPGGTLAGARAMRGVIDGDYNSEYEVAIKTWGKVD